MALFELGGEMSEYVLIIEGELGTYAAYIPDLPGCVAVGKTVGEVRRRPW